MLAQQDLQSSYSQTIEAIQANFDIMNRFVKASEASHRDLMMLDVGATTASVGTGAVPRLGASSRSTIPRQHPNLPRGSR